MRSRRLPFVCITVAAAAIVWPHVAVPVFAWGAVGHRVVARLAWALMTPAARDQAASLFEIGQEPGRERRAQEAFVAAATWADDVRPTRPETYNWHFVDIPVAANRYDAVRDCPPTERGDCAIAAIARARLELVDTSRPVALRAEALKFLIHFVGDLHQPLHATDNHDRGGNDVKVAALRGDDGRATNLHAVWDTGLINLVPETEVQRADRLMAELKTRLPGLSLDPVVWAEESHEVGVRVVYRYASFVPADPGPETITLDEAYRTEAYREIDRRQQLAGARLGALLSSLLK